MTRPWQNTEDIAPMDRLAASRPVGREDVDADLARMAHVAGVFDDRFRLPGTSFRFGWDAILGLVPGVGDAVTLAPAAWMMYSGWKWGIRRRVLAQMAGNTAFDVTFGSIPFLGDLLDAGFKAHRRNLALLEDEVQRLRRKNSA